LAETSPSEKRAAVLVELITMALRADNQVTLRATGTSMLPSIWPGDVLTIAPAREPLPAVGEVTLVLDHGRLRAHRVIGRDIAARLRTRGDALEATDPLTGELLGTVIARNGRLSGLTNGPSRWRAWSARAALRLGPLLVIGLKLRALIQLRRRDRGLETARAAA
jgi:hypothetical protein